MSNQKCNVKMCPHVDSWKNRIDTGAGTIFLCDRCQEALDKRLGDKSMLSGMQKAVMSSVEIQQMRDERENMRIEKDLAATIAAAHAVAGSPRWLMLPAPEVMA